MESLEDLTAFTSGFKYCQKAIHTCNILKKQKKMVYTMRMGLSPPKKVMFEEPHINQISRYQSTFHFFQYMGILTSEYRYVVWTLP